MNYLIDIINKDEIYKFLEKYIKYTIKNLNNDEITFDKIQNDLINYFEQKILKTLEK
jgi:hypothetical protein